MAVARDKKKRAVNAFARGKPDERQSDEPGGKNPLLGLQQQVGNRAVANLIESHGLSSTSPQIQRAPRDANSATPETTQAVEPEAAAARALIVEDDAASVGPGQMRKSEFLEQLRSTVCATADAALAEAGQSTAGCPYIEQWFGYYADKPPSHIERALRKYAPETAGAGSARDYIPAVSNRVRQAIGTWARTGELTGVPEELRGMLGPGAMLGAIGGMLGSIGSAIGGAVSAAAGAIGSAFSSIGKALFKRKEGKEGHAENNSPAAIQQQLSGGRPLDGGAKSRMGAAFGHDFSSVRVHTNDDAAELSDSLNARAFTIGSDIAFGPGEYQPGTMIGDALLAHELAHVVQQQGGQASSAPQSKDDSHNGLENEADVAAAGAVSSLWLGAQGGLADIGRDALPKMKSGLKLQSCTKHTVTNRGTIVKTRDSGHEKEVMDRGGSIKRVNTPNMTWAEVDELMRREHPPGLLSKVTKVGPPTNDYDCHGYTFLNGGAWIDNDQVPAIIADNEYKETATPVVGDIVIYLSGGEYKHSGVIKEVSGNKVTKITSKWGLWGLYSHAPDDVPTIYGTWKAYHSNRPDGNKLRRQK